MAAQRVGRVSLEGIRITSDAHVWTGEFDLNTLRVDEEILNPERKRCGFKNIRIRVDMA